MLRHRLGRVGLWLRRGRLPLGRVSLRRLRRRRRLVRGVLLGLWCLRLLRSRGNARRIAGDRPLGLLGRITLCRIRLPALLRHLRRSTIRRLT